MSVWMLILAATGLSFWATARIAWVYEKAYGDNPWPWLRTLVECGFCSGFWSGWVVWGLSWLATGQPDTYRAFGFGGVLFAFAAAMSNLVVGKVADFLIVKVD